VTDGVARAGAERGGPKRVLMTADAVGGVWSYALELAAGLCATGTKVTLAVMGPRPSTEALQGAARVPGLDLREGGYRLEWMDDPWEDVDAAGAWLMGLARETEADLVHLNGFAHAALPFEVPVLVVAHSCVLTWWRAVERCDAPARFDEYRRRVRQGVDAAGLVVAPTAAMLAAFVAAHGPVPEGRVIANGRNPAAFRPARKDDLVLSAGRLRDRAKNLWALGQAARGLPWPVYVAGDPPAPGADGALWTLGRLPTDELAGWMARAAVYAHPARYEPFGLGPLEAALSGAALVLGNVPSLREVWGSAAAFADPDDADELHRVLAHLCRDRIARERLAARATERARTFTAERMCAAYRAAYAELLSGRAGARPARPSDVVGHAVGGGA
jgi:glycogen synthase